MINYLRVVYHLHTLIRRSFWDKAKLGRFQNYRLRKIVSHAYNYVPFYHRKFRELGIYPSDIKSTDDLKKLPIIRKDEIRQNQGAIISNGFALDRLKKLSTSGSTGEPLFLYVSSAENEFRKAKHLRANMSCGQRPFDRWVTITAPHHFAESMRLQKILNLFSPSPISVFDNTNEQIMKLEEMRPDVLDGYSSSLFLLAKEIEKKDIRTITPRFLIGGAEFIDEYSRNFIEETLNAPFYDQYSSVEFERIAWQCPVKKGYHMDVDAISIEFVDDDGEEVSFGEKGEIVCTSLFSYAMPFIRYAVGDIGAKSDEYCECGRNLPLMEVVEGRKDSLLRLPDGRTLTPRAFTIAFNMFKLYSYIDQFRVIQKKQDLFHIFVIIKDDKRNYEKVLRKELPVHLRKTINLPAGSVKFEIDCVNEIPLDKSGKLMTVVSEL
jgi:phenylacetate-CoA ligase